MWCRLCHIIFRPLDRRSWSARAWRKWHRWPYGQAMPARTIRQTSVLYRGWRMTGRSSPTPWANWQCTPYGQLPDSCHLLHSSVLKAPCLSTSISRGSWSLFFPPLTYTFCCVNYGFSGHWTLGICVLVHQNSIVNKQLRVKIYIKNVQ